MRLTSYDSSSISTLLSSLGGSENGSSGSLGINFSDYASIRSGAYGKLLRSYYALNSDNSKKASSSDSTSKTSKKSTAVSKDSTKTIANIEEDAGKLEDSAKQLYTRKNNSVFTKDSKGNYDTDKIYDKVSDFVEDYNSFLVSAAKSDTSRIESGVESVKNITKANATALKEIGISVNEKNGALTIDSKTFKDADMSKVKDLFYGTGSYTYSVATQASLVKSYAESEAAKANTYGNKAQYNYNYNSGDIFSDAF